MLGMNRLPLAPFPDRSTGPASTPTPSPGDSSTTTPGSVPRPDAPTFLDRLRDAELSSLVLNGAGLEMRFQADPSRPEGPLIPLIVSDGKRGKASVFSPTAHYLHYPLLEMGRNASLPRKAAYAALGMPWEVLFHATRLDRVVYVNHWLLKGAPPLELDHNALNVLIQAIKADHPGHAVVFSGIVPAITPHLGRVLTALGGRAVQSRTLHLVDMNAPVSGPSRRGMREKRNVDRRLYESRLPDRILDRGKLLDQAGRIRELYAQLYLRKYSTMNPQYTEEFFRIVIQSEEFHVAAWFDNGGLEAFNIRLVRDRINHWSICGYDVHAPRKKGLFRLVAAEDVFGPGEIRLINWGGGNESFKRFRGAQPVTEYDVVFDDHLSALRRFPWQVLRELCGIGKQAVAAHPVLSKSGHPVPEAQAPPMRRVALITSIPEMVAPFLSRDLESLGLEIPIAVLIKPSSLLSDRLRTLPRDLKRQARINRTWRWAQVMNRVVYYRLASGAERDGTHGKPLAAALEQLSLRRQVVEAGSANDSHVVSALRDAKCELGIVVGADVLTRKTLEAVGMPLVNLHTSDPSVIRGMPPVFWEIRDGLSEVTITLHRVVVELDAGPVLVQRKAPIQWRQSLGDTLTATRHLLGREIAALLSDALPRLLDGRLEEKRLPPGPIRTIPRIADTMRARKICRERARHPPD